MIAIMTNQGALEVGRSLSGGSRFLAWEAALLKENFDGASVNEVASLTSENVDLRRGQIANKQVVHTFECTGSLPVPSPYRRRLRLQQRKRHREHFPGIRRSRGACPPLLQISNGRLRQDL